MDALKIEILYTDGWKASAKGSINGHTVSYNGERHPTPEEALARALEVLSAYGLGVAA